MTRRADECSLGAVDRHGGTLLVWMAVAAACAAVVCSDLLVGIAGLAAAGILAILRRQDGAPLLLLCLGYQWLFVVAGITYRGVYGRYPSDHRSAELDTAVLLLLGALLLVAVGIAAGLKWWASMPIWRARRARLADCSGYAIDKLLLCVLVLYAGSWIGTTNPKSVAYSISQVLYRLVEFRTVFLFLLFVAVLRWPRGWPLALAAAAFVMFPLVTGGGSGFASVLIVLLAAVLTEGRALFVDWLRTRHGRRTFALLCVTGIVLANLGIMWQGAVKSRWRPIARSAELEASRIDRIGMFFEVASASVAELNWKQGVTSLAERMSDVPMLLALTLERVPSEVAHQDGALTARAIRHITMPRFLFPEKENLGSDSWLVRKFAGLNVAGEAQGTSIGLSYLIEFYIDYGLPGMLAGAFLFGLFVGTLYRLLLFAAPSMDLYHATAAAILLQHFFSLDGNLAKIVGGMVMAYVVFAALLLLFGGALHHALLAAPAGQRARRVDEPLAAARTREELI